jgi:ABC-type multidrug transport system ATPase subunit
LMRGRTTFVIAHRLSTVRRAQQILMIEAGRIIERGTHESLYATRGRYYDLYTKQHEASGEGNGEAEQIGVAQSAASLLHGAPVVSPGAAWTQHVRTGLVTERSSDNSPGLFLVPKGEAK